MNTYKKRALIFFTSMLIQNSSPAMEEKRDKVQKHLDQQLRFTLIIKKPTKLKRKKVNRLLRQGAQPHVLDVALCNSCPPSILHSLIRNGADPNNIGYFGLTPLHFALHIRQAACLLQHGADPTIKSNNNQTPRAHAVACDRRHIAARIDRWEKQQNKRIITLLLSINAKYPHVIYDVLYIIADMLRKNIGAPKQGSR